jgi:hypothetical protein
MWKSAAVTRNLAFATIRRAAPFPAAGRSRRLAGLVVWEIVFMLVILKIPVVYVCWVIWWAVKSEPELGAEGESPPSGYWQPWRRRPKGRPPRNGPHGAPTRAAVRTPPPTRKTTA